MKIIRYLNQQNTIEYGLQHDGWTERLNGNIVDKIQPTGEKASVVKLLAPVVPTAILCIGLNYRHHAKESGAQIPAFPILFMKGTNSLQNPSDPIQIPSHLASKEVDYESELAVVIGKSCKNVRCENALEYVLGYTCANDVSARDWQLKRGGGQWCRGKTFDTFCPLGPRLVTTDEVSDPNALHMQGSINGEIVQDWDTKDMIFDVPSLIEFLSGSTTLLPGTVILTGTPHGVGMASKPQRWLKPGDTFTVEIDGIGELSNPVTVEK